MKQIVCVLGQEGRVGSAFTRRLKADGYEVMEESWFHECTWDQEPLPMVFHCQFDPLRIDRHLNEALESMCQWKYYSGIFVPSSYWIGTDSLYGMSKLVIEQAAKFYNKLGANIVTDRIGYFPGDGVDPNPNDPFFDKLVDGDTLYARVMERMLK